VNTDISELKDFLEEKVNKYNTENFIEADPISVPHMFTLKEDIEIAGFLSATIAWGNRKMIVKNAHRLVNIMGGAPFDFIMSHNESQLDRFDGFVHRTFNDIDARYFIKALKHIYTNYKSPEEIFNNFTSEETIKASIHRFNIAFFEIQHPQRTRKHIADPLKGSAAKKINMFLRWMVRKDEQGVDFGIWKTIKPAQLYIPLDVHVGNIARLLQLLNRKPNDWQATEELTQRLREFDADDPVKYDYALFGLGIFEKFGANN